MVKIQINFTNRWLYTFALVIGILALAVGVYAYGTSSPSTFGHSSGELNGVCLSDGTNCLARTVDTNTRCDGSAFCAEVCIAGACRSTWPSFTQSTDFPNGLTWDNSQLVKGQGGAIELGGTNNAANAPGNTPFIDFHYGSRVEDYNVRFINSADGELYITTARGGTRGKGDVKLWAERFCINGVCISSQQLYNLLYASGAPTSSSGGGGGSGCSFPGSNEIVDCE